MKDGCMMYNIIQPDSKSKIVLIMCIYYVYLLCVSNFQYVSYDCDYSIFNCVTLSFLISILLKFKYITSYY